MAAAAPTLTVNPSFGPLPDVPATRIQSFLSIGSRPVSTGDWAAQKAARILFDAPRLRSYPKKSFLGRLVVEMSLREEIRDDAQLVTAVCKKALTLLQQDRLMVSREEILASGVDPTDPHLNHFDSINRLGNLIEEKKNQKMEELFTAVIDAFPLLQNHLRDDLDLTYDELPVGTRGAYFRNWMRKTFRETPIQHDLAYGVPCAETTVPLQARTARAAQGLVLGLVLNYAFSLDSCESAHVILQNASFIDPDYLGIIIINAVLKYKNQLLNVFSKNRREWCLQPHLQTAFQSTGEAGRALLQRYFPSQVNRILEEDRRQREKERRLAHYASRVTSDVW